MHMVDEIDVIFDLPLKTYGDYLLLIGLVVECVVDLVLLVLELAKDLVAVDKVVSYLFLDVVLA